MAVIEAAQPQENALHAEEVPTNGISLWVEPQRLDFGILKPGHGANATLKVAGGPAQVTVHSDRLRVTPTSFGLERTELQLTLLPGSAGELMWDDVLLQGKGGELKVLVTARWEELSPPMPEPEQVSIPEPAPATMPKQEQEQVPDLAPTENQVDGRTFKGKKCRWCGKNIHYDSDSHSWKPCKTCRGPRIPVGMITRLSREFYLGMKELRPALTEIWETLIGKEGHKG